ncbi:MAG: tetratricopeptide repeat protein [Dysgonamonadaceae bacterium]|jgi:tetratricopeptide (TPR) repeat protein/DNA-binding CsgD family transcriptional regulator|nr:tetratricopeptide repeat protein [Dysgonamonadaceae bacterium]
MEKLKKYIVLLIKNCFLFLFFIFTTASVYPETNNKTAAILLDSKQLVMDECGENDRTYSILQLLDSLARVQILSETDFRKAINQTGGLFKQQEKLIPAVELYLNVISYYKQMEKPSREQIKSLVSFYIPLGASHEELGMWNRSLNFYFEALNLAEGYNFEPQKAMIYNNMGAIYYTRGELEKAEYYLLKAIDINKKSGAKKELFNNYNNLGGIYIKRKDYNRAMETSLLAIQQLDDEEDAYLYYFMQNNIATIYLLKNDPNLAISYLSNAKEHQIKHEFNSDLVRTYASLSRAFEMIGMKDSTRLYIEKSLQQVQLINNKHIESQILQEMADYYERNGNTAKAYHALKRVAQINDSISRVDNQQKMNDLERMYLADKKIRENELEIKNITLQKLASDRLWIISASIAILLIIAVLYLINYSKNKEKERKNEELLLQHQAELHEKEKELQKQKEMDLNDTIDKKNRELASYTLYVIKNNEFIAGIKEELKQLLLELNPKDRRTREEIRQLINKLNQQHSTDNWEEFSYYFEKVHPSFYHNLEERYPDLTPKEKRLCAFLKLGLSSKEISAITFKEVRSVESARNRLRKKLGISPEDSLTEFLQNNILSLNG